MTKGFARVDDALIDRLFQPLADWLEHRLALGPHRAARSGIDLASLAWICAQAGDAAATMHAHDTGFLIVRAAVMVVGLWAFTTLRGVFRRKDGGAQARAQANPLRAGMQLHRVTCLMWMIALAVRTVLVPGSFGALALMAVGVFATAAIYLGACTNPPPRRRESRAHGFGRDLAFGTGGL